MSYQKPLEDEFGGLLPWLGALAFVVAWPFVVVWMLFKKVKQ